MSTSPPSSSDRRALRMNRALKVEKLQLRLLMLEEKYRGDVMSRQVEAFEEKVFLSLQNFNIDLLASMVKNLRSIVKSATNITSISTLHKAVVQSANKNKISHQRNARDRQNQPISDEDNCLKYFMWFFEYMDYLKDLKVNFSERIFQPLFKYFYEGGSGGDDDRRSSSSTLSFSKLSQFSGDSGGSGEKSDDQDDVDNVTSARQKAQSKAALMILSNEFADIRTLYDTTEIDSVAQKLSLVKEQMDFLLDNEDSIDCELYSPESERLLYHLDLDDDTETLVRYVPDVLFKFKKSAFLARRWLQVDSVRMKDLNLKLEKIVELESKLKKRLSVLDEDIQKNEEELEQDMLDLENLLKREERSNDLGLEMVELDDRIEKLQTKLERLRRERDKLTTMVMDSIKVRSRRQYEELKVKYESNRLQRYIVQRQLGTLRYHRDVTEQDMTVELSIKPSLIHQTNSLQDQCERLEEQINKDRNEKFTIKTALIPIGEDRKVVSERLLQKRMSEPVPDATTAQYLGSKRPVKNGGQALFVKTHHVYEMATKKHRSKFRPSTPLW